MSEAQEKHSTTAHLEYIKLAEIAKSRGRAFS